MCKSYFCLVLKFFVLSLSATAVKIVKRCRRQRLTFLSAVRDDTKNFQLKNYPRNITFFGFKNKFSSTVGNSGNKFVALSATA